jgi:hypothetical protein
MSRIFNSKQKTAGGFDKPAEPPRIKRREVIKEGIDQELSIDQNYLNEEIMDQPLYFRKYTRELAKIKRKVAAVEQQLDYRESQLVMELSSDGKGRKVAEVQAMVCKDETIQKLKTELADAKELEVEFEGIVKAFAQRHEMLKDLSANLRKELT